MKTIQFRNYELAVSLDEYQNGRLAVSLHDAQTQEPFGTVTVNLPDANIVAENTSYLDVNNCSDLIDLFIELELVEIVSGVRSASGFCTYPLGAFDLDKLEEYID